MRRSLFVSLFVACAACGPSPSSSDGGAPDGGTVATDGGLVTNALVLGGLNPGHGPLVGGTTVVVTGRGFAPGLVVSFGRKPGTTLTLASDTQLTVVTPPGASAGPVEVSAALGSELDSLPGAFTYDPSLVIDYCVVQAPKSLSVAALATTPLVYGRVHVPGVTTDAGNQGEIEGEVGYGKVGSDPESQGSTWTWSAATWNAACLQCGNNLEYQGSFTAPAPGAYDFAYRFSADLGQSWTACDAHGDTPSSPYSPANAAPLTVAVAGADGGTGDGGTGDGGLPPIGLCALKYPTAVEAAPGVPTPPVFGQVYLAGVTTAAGNQGEIEGEVGYGPTGSDPGAGWTWAQATFNPSCSDCNAGKNYEYEATLTVAQAGVYALAYRFSDDQGAHYQSCDTAWDPVYDPSKAGVLTVAAPDAGTAGDAGSPPDAGADAGLAPDAGTDAGSAVDAGADAGAAVVLTQCNLQFPTSFSVEPGAPSPVVYGRVTAPGVTTSVGNQAEIVAEVGYGPTGTTPGATWTFSPAVYNASCNGCSGDYEYQGGFAAPGLGTYAYAYRFSGDHGASWMACDTAAGDAVYDPSKAGVLTVAYVAVSWCNLQSPPTLTAAVGIDAGPVFGRVYQLGVTDSAGHEAEFQAEVGYGPAGGDPRSQDGGFRWFPASYNTSCLACGNNYEYGGDLVPTDAGTFDYYSRFSADDGGYWTACSQTGPYDPDGGNDAGLLTVP